MVPLTKYPLRTNVTLSTDDTLGFSIPTAYLTDFDVAAAVISLNRGNFHGEHANNSVPLYTTIISM